jgi:hypothetical protein
VITRFFWGSLIEPRSNQNQTRAATALYAVGFVSVPEIEVEKTDGLKGPKLPVDAGPIRNFRAEILSVFLTRAGGAAATATGGGQRVRPLLAAFGGANERVEGR